MLSSKLVVDKQMIHTLGLNEAILYGELAAIFLRSYNQGGGMWFIATYNDLYSELGFNKNTLTRLTKSLIEAGVLVDRYKTVEHGRLRYYRLTAKVEEYSSIKTESLEFLKYDDEISKV